MAWWTASLDYLGYTVLVSAGGVSLKDEGGTYTSKSIKPPKKKPKKKALKKLADEIVDEYEGWIYELGKKQMADKLKMDASKENALKAREALTTLSDQLGEETRTKHSAQLIFLQEFIDSANKRLPSAKAIAKDKDRKKKYGKKGKKNKTETTSPYPPGVPAA